ncbi:MAG: DUF3883 domain-containing protein [Planctomycetaceae bacterium]
MERKNLVGMLAGYYLSRFDKVAYGRFSGQSHSAVHKYLAERIGVPASSVKLWRDEFDPIHANSRQGWHKRKMAPSRLRMAEMLGGVSEVGVYGLLIDCFENQEANVVELLREIDAPSPGSNEKIPTRSLTGGRAEEQFINWFRTGKSIFTGPLDDCRLLQCGYDFEAFYAGAQAYIEVKGLRDNSGGVLMTDKEWTTCAELGELYFMILVRSVEATRPTIEVYRNPAETLKARQNVATVVQVSWTIPKLDSSLAVWAN